MKASPQPAKRRRYDPAFRAEALRLADESRSTQAAARALNISPKLLYKWQKAVLTPVAAAQGPGTAAELRQLRALARRQAHELESLKKPLPSECSSRNITDRYPMSRYRFIQAQRERYPVRLLCHVLGLWSAGIMPGSTRNNKP